MRDTDIVSFKIFPSIGIARVGNSPDEYFFGPEVPGPHPRDPGNFRDAQGKIKRQAARFRVYGFNRSGKVVREVTGERGVDITWRVQVANTKSSWFNFDLALDIPAAAKIVSTRRNASVTNRESLEITPPARTITGTNQNSDGRNPEQSFHGQYQGQDVYLGELRTDGEGHLIFLGGRGLSANPSGQPATTFANNDGWHDDTCDGSVNATVKYNGTTYEAVGAWVVVGPPNYAPGIQGMVTGFDLLFDLACRQNAAHRVEKPRFSREIWPLLRRFSDHQWVNAGFAREFGIGTLNHWTDPAVMRRLADNGDGETQLRHAIFNLFRPADYSIPLSNALPGYYGDAMDTDQNFDDPRQGMAVTPTQYTYLQQWANGDFVSDVLDIREHAPDFDSLTAVEQIEGINKAVLDETLGGPFHPGAEFTWPMRHAMMYSELSPTSFRIKHRASEPNYGAQLTPESVLAEGGPLDGSVPGAITRWMAVPWQTDTSSCLSGYLAYVDDYLPTFWPARVPNDVMTEAQYQTLISHTASEADKLSALSYLKRPKWLRGVRYPQDITFPPQINSHEIGCNIFVDKWSEVGIVLQRWHNGNPTPYWVETGRTLDSVATEAKQELKPIHRENPRRISRKA